MDKSKTKNKAPITTQKKIIVIVLILVVVILWSLVFYFLFKDKNRGSSTPEPMGKAFSRELYEYDLYNAPMRALEGESPERIERRISALQNKVRRQEEQLSVLKRRRIMALIDRRYVNAYKEATGKAAESFPYSTPIAIIAAEALVFDGVILSAQERAQLRSYASRVSQIRYSSIELAMRILAGELEEPGTALAIPGIEGLLSLDLSSFPDQVRRDLNIDEFLYRAFNRDTPGAAVRMNSLATQARSNAPAFASPLVRAETIRMGAEFFYDHRNPLRAAELFLLASAEEPFSRPLSGLLSETSEERDLSRAADSLVLAGEVLGARNIWLALSLEERDIPVSSLRARERNLYNLSSSALDEDEEGLWLQRLFRAQSRSGVETGTEVFSIVKYTRLMDTDHAIAVLSEDGIKKDPLLELELLRRSLDRWAPRRSTAEVWMLLGKNPYNEALYEWAAWYFDHQRQYIETQQLLIEASRRGMKGSWISLHQSLALLREGKLDEGEKILRDAFYGHNPVSDWRVPANLGRIQESRLAISSALGYYEAAALLVRNRDDAVAIQTRLSRCLEALGRFAESRKALEYALELDPENLNIRRELRRFENR